jgi:uncharacterized protein with PIN domain
MASMKKEQMLEELQEACRSLGYRVRFERGDFAGGACILKDQQLLVVNKRFTIERKLSTIARALSEIGIDEVYIKPAVRSFIEDELAKAAQ